MLKSKVPIFEKKITIKIRNRITVIFFFFSNYSFSKRLPSGNTGILMMLNSQFFLLALLRRKSYSTFSVLRPSANNRNKI